MMTGLDLLEGHDVELTRMTGSWST